MNIQQLLEEKEKEEQISRLKIWILEIYDLISFIIFALGFVLFIKYFIFTPFNVVGHSMEPTVHNGDFLIVNEITPRLKKQLHRWQIVIFSPPWKDIDYIKRIIGLPGEIVKIMSGSVYICHKNWSWMNCKKLKEPYLATWTITKPTCWIDTFYVKSWTYFVLWDNREHSTDSRCCFSVGCYSWASYLVPKENIIWIPLLRITKWQLQWYGFWNKN